MFFLLAIILTTSCSVDYDYDDLKIKSNLSERIIIRGLLNPVQPIQIHLYKLQYKDNRYNSLELKNAHVTIKEDQKIIYDGICMDTVLNLYYYPKENAHYSIEVSIDRLKVARAKTQIPPAIKCKSYFSYGEYVWDQSMYIFELSSFEIPQTERIGLWITSYQVFQNEEEVQYNELYTKNALVDKANSVAGMPVKNEVVGSIYHQGYLRVKNKNLQHLEELTFTPNFVYVTRDDDPWQEYPQQTKIKTKLITASPEYDQFCKSLYEQKSMIANENDLSSVFFQPKTVYSNIENGLGIFAGINEVNYIVDLPITEN